MSHGLVELGEFCVFLLEEFVDSVFALDPGSPDGEVHALSCDKDLT